MWLETLISLYGYPAVFVGTFCEGETILVVAGFAAHQGYLKHQWVILLSFLGTVCGDQLYFYSGRAGGIRFLEKRPPWKTKSDRIFSLLKRHSLLLILGFRFVYGMRTITPFAIGASGTSPLRFLVLNMASGFFWASLIGSAGCVFGRTLELLLGGLKRYELFLFMILAAAGALVWFLHWRRKEKTLLHRWTEHILGREATESLSRYFPFRIFLPVLNIHPSAIASA